MINKFRLRIAFLFLRVFYCALVTMSYNQFLSFIFHKTVNVFDVVFINFYKCNPDRVKFVDDMFCDILYCADCGHKMWFNVCHPNTDIKHFKCSNYKSNRGTCEGTHYIRADSLETVVTMELRRLSKYLHNDEDAFAELLENKSNKDIAKRQKYLSEEIQKASVRIKDVERLYERLYEDNVNGKVTDNWYMQLSTKYEKERDELQAKIREFRMEQINLDDMKNEKEQFTNAVRSFLQMDKLTPMLLKELIEKIEVHNIVGKGKNRSQEITIHYRFLGVIEIPTDETYEPLKLDTRQGVAVEYISNAISA